jgi:anti-sigma B factor antagonist
VSKSDGRVSARIDGEIDLANGRKLVRYLKDLIREPGQRVEVDLSGVAFLDSSGLQALIAAHHLAGERGSELILVAPSAVVRRLLRLTGCDAFFTIVSSDADMPVDGAQAAG